MATWETLVKWRLQSVVAMLFLFINCIPAQNGTVKMQCAKPDQPSLLQALSPVFDLDAIRPVLNPEKPTNVYVYFTMYGILGVDEKAQLLITYIWQDYYWMNDFISWDPVQCGTDKISLPKEKFWVPDIVINEFMDENKAPSVPYIYLYSDGRVRDSQPVRIVSSCNLNIYTFPFDIQECTLTFNSYIFYAIDIMILPGRDADQITNNSKQVMTTMGEWELLDITAKKLKPPQQDGLYTDKLVFTIRVRRRSTMYVLNLLIPSCFLITVDLFSFLLPPQTIDRSSFKMTLILGYSVFLLIMNDMLPVTGNTIPLINVFFSLCLALMVGSLLETVFITNLLCRSANFSPLPRCLRVLFLDIFGFLVCMPKKTGNPSKQELEPESNSVIATPDVDSLKNGDPAGEDKALQELKSLSGVLQAIRVEVEQQQKGSQSSEDWLQVGFVIDRLLFGLYILFISVSFITIIVLWVISYNQ